LERASWDAKSHGQFEWQITRRSGRNP
jgi:hypothetical protein